MFMLIHDGDIENFDTPVQQIYPVTVVLQASDR